MTIFASFRADVVLKALVFEKLTKLDFGRYIKVTQYIFICIPHYTKNSYNKIKIIANYDCVLMTNIFFG